jgi:putative nucleotidyltransferase with HDIG domain
VLLGADGAALVATATALLSGLALEGDLRETIYVFLGSIAAAGTLALPQKRSDLLKAGVAAGAVQIAMVAAFSLYDAGDPSTSAPLLPTVLAAIGSGLVAGVLSLGLVPVYEGLGYLTNFKLLELASLGSPLLKELSVQAPGTYHHSVVVGSLAEAAAEAVGANPLFARVACYYHDIGKMKKPQYFIENRQSGEANLHDRLTPSMSALVVESHVKDGIEMGLASGLPKAIVDVIPQHHGTRLISFFFNKAKAQAESEGENAPNIVESDFRYPGPKPQTREAGIIMLADGVEASTRSIGDPTPVRVHAMVQKVFSIIQGDGQLDECDLSLKDLATIGGTFEKVLLGMYHRRVAYPATADISTGAAVVQMPLTRKGEE